MSVAFHQDRQNLSAYARYIQLEQLRRQDAIEEAADILVFQRVENPRDQATDGFGDLCAVGRSSQPFGKRLRYVGSFSFPSMFLGVRKFS